VNNSGNVFDHYAKYEYIHRLYNIFILFRLKMHICFWNLDLEWCSWFSCQVSENAVFSDQSICNIEMVKCDFGL